MQLCTFREPIHNDQFLLTQMTVTMKASLAQAFHAFT